MVANKTNGAVKEWVGLSKEERMEQGIPENTGSASIAGKMGGGSFMAIGRFKKRIWRIIWPRKAQLWLFGMLTLHTWDIKRFYKMLFLQLLLFAKNVVKNKLQKLNFRRFTKKINSHVHISSGKK